MFIATRNDLDEYMDRLSERLYEIAAPSITPEQFRAVWETLRLVGDVAADLFNRLQKERDSALAAEAARERCANALQRSSATHFQEELEDLRKALDEAHRERDDALNRLDNLRVNYYEMKSSRDRALARLEDVNDAVEYYRGLRDAAEEEVRRLRDELDERPSLTERDPDEIIANMTE